jgi:hypothetical protein
MQSETKRFAKNAERNYAFSAADQYSQSNIHENPTIKWNFIFNYNFLYKFRTFALSFIEWCHKNLKNEL